MEWIIFVDLGLVVAVVAIAAILAAIGVAGVVVWIWPAVKIIVGILFAIVMIVGIYLYVKEVITSERSIFTKTYIFLLCAVNAIWSGALVWIFVGLMTDEFTHGNLIEVIIIILLGIPIVGFCTLAPALLSWCAAGLAIESANETSISKCVLSTLLTAVCIAVPTLIYVFSASHFFSVAKYFPKFIQGIFA